MKRRPYLATLGSSLVGGCLSSVPGVDDDRTNVTSSELAPPTNWSDEVIAEESFDWSATPICVDGEDRNGRIESNPGGTITDHHFFDDGTDRYGVRGRIEFDDLGSYIETVRATFDQDDGERVIESRSLFRRSRETYLFEIVTTEGSADAVDRYTLEEPEGGTSGPSPTIEDGSTLVEKGWGQLGRPTVIRSTGLRSRCRTRRRRKPARSESSSRRCSRTKPSRSTIRPAPNSNRAKRTRSTFPICGAIRVPWSRRRFDTGCS
ncbi:hypothetical protein ACFQMM_13385 [Saliphagus sp. GCM10025308]